MKGSMCSSIAHLSAQTVRQEVGDKGWVWRGGRRGVMGRGVGKGISSSRRGAHTWLQQSNSRNRRRPANCYA